jgi:hypothetical protein
VFLHDIGRFSEEHLISKFVFDERRIRILGEEHLDTIEAMNGFAITLGQQGELDEAGKMFEEVVGKRRRILGEDNPSTIEAMIVHRDQLDGAAKMKKEALD